MNARVPVSELQTWRFSRDQNRKILEQMKSLNDPRIARAIETLERDTQEIEAKIAALETK